MLKQTLLSLVLLVPLVKPLINFAEIIENPLNADYSDQLSELQKSLEDINKKLKKHFGDPDAALYKIPSLFQGPSLNQSFSQFLALLSLQNIPEQLEALLKKEIKATITAAPSNKACALFYDRPNDLTECSNNSMEKKLIYYGKTIPLSIAYPWTGRIRNYNYSLSKQNEKNNFLLSANTLFGHETYGNLSKPITLNDDSKINTEKEAAQLYLDYLTDPIPPKFPDNMPTSTGETPLDLKFYIDLRSYSALKSLLRQNLEEIIAKRTSVAPAPNHKSQAAIEKEMATRRLKKYFGEQDSWYNKMEKANPATVNREIAYLLSEMNYQLYLNRQIQEKILATLSAVGANSLTVTKPVYKGRS